MLQDLAGACQSRWSTNTMIQGNAAQADLVLEAIEHGWRQLGTGRAEAIAKIVRVVVRPRNPNSAMFRLGMARRLDALRPSNRTVLEPWVVEVTLSRFGSRRLSKVEQDVIVKATRAPHKVKWPDWWDVFPWQSLFCEAVAQLQGKISLKGM
ncbi:MAG: hypothetical protein M9924_12510 [Rhizobiaceae bacterium]|nr:hypothetical protein [Rhizobiaceae bacterium]